jgi:Bifunctional DNA primase/polymerase, N-terminal
MQKMLSSALNLAADGLPVFPCAISTKRPTTPHGFKDAHTDPDEIQRLWHDHPGGLIGIATGAISGFDVLDIDAKHQKAGDWWRDHRGRIPQTRIHRTRSGGLHLLFEHNAIVRCSAGRIALGIDTRADGGYIIHWPSSGLPVLSDAPLARWPSWLLKEFLQKSPPRPPSPSNAIIDRSIGWLRGLVRSVAGASEGQRNSILFWASCRAGEAVRDGKAAEDFVIDVLLRAAAHAGLSRLEAQRTIYSGMRR